MRIVLLVFSLLLSGCLGMPRDVEPVKSFELDRYLGTWYEIARLDHSFERGLTHVSADYSLRDDGGVRVLNRGFDKAENTWREAEGKAYLVADPQQGHFKVSFFGPFYSSYVVFELDEAYRYAFVSGYNRSYLWLLARTPTVSQEVRTRFMVRSKALGFDIDSVIFVEQN
ncbi:lipocalin family protein [Zobellella maritima]|uniref:lipocalin family protein n=1 Tax=Zobellella maritima TaxID=2059725 RepID=UPI000E302755|nr:lipocalin family protein [Zobellella maritima]